MLPTRIAGAALALLALLPLWRVLPRRPTGLAGSATAELAASYSSLIWSVVIIALIPALIAALMFDATRLETTLQKLAAPLTRLPVRAYAFSLAVVALLIAFGVSTLIGPPRLIDSFAQLTQARYFAAGMLAGPNLPGQEFWHIQQTVITPHGWVSQYPPGYTALLAVGLLVGSPALIGPVLLAVAVFFTTLIAEELIVERTLARAAALLAALSPFMLVQSAAYMSHVAAAAVSAAALYYVVRAARGGLGFVAVAGACIGMLFTIRPLTGVVAGGVAAAYTLFDRQSRRENVTRVALGALAAAPFIALVAAYNAHFFGSVATFGYQAALGPNGGLGFGVDPWGNQYGVLEALAYTSAELTALNVHLLETPLPLVLLIGIHFAISRAPALSRSPEALLFWWVAALVVANFFYWHHGLFMGPRMLADAGPLWVLLAVIAVAGLIARIRSDQLIARKYSVRAFATGGVCAALIGGLLLLAPQRVLSYTSNEDLALRTAPEVNRPALVFVHGGWTTRIAMRLAAHGMRLDSVETALRQNSTCATHHYAAAFARAQKPDRTLDFAPRAMNLPASVEISPGNRIRVVANETMDAECAAEIAADRVSVIDVAPYVWQGDLAGLARNGALFVRDMGPVENAQLIARHPHRVPQMLIEQAGRLSLAPYDASIRQYWPARRAVAL